MWLLTGTGVGHNGGVSDIPRWAFSRGAKLASLPLGVAGRATVGLGKRIGGRPAELVASELQARTADQLFRVLGELKGGAMKFGQALSVFEAALPEELAAPYRAALTKLQEAAPPMPPATVHKVLAAGLGAEWREMRPQVDTKPLSHIMRDGTQERRVRAGLLLVRFLFSGPARAGLLHADPHPGNFRLLDDGRLVVLDYGAVNRLPDGLPPAIGPLVRLALRGEADAVLDGLRKEGFVRTEFEVDAHEVLDYVTPMLDPIREPTFHFTRAWLRHEAARVADPRSPANALGRQLNLPPTYLLIHRVTLGGIGVLCQLGTQAPFRGEMESWLPGFAGGERRTRKPMMRPDPRIPTPEETAVVEPGYGDD